MLTLLWIGVSYLKRFKLFNTIFHVDKRPNLCSLPPKWHINVTLEEHIRKVLFVGDVHGCCDELTELLGKAGVFNNDDIMVIFVGDICNKGPKNAETIRLIQKLGSSAYSVRGNHEQAVLLRLKQCDEPGMDLPNKYSWIRHLSVDERVFLEQLPFTISIPSLNVIVVHGGLLPGVKLLDQNPHIMLSMRNYVHERLTGSKNIDDGLQWASQWQGPQFVIFGHDARRHLQKHRHAIGLDTGCLYGFQLTGYLINVNTKNPLSNGKFVSVKAHSVHVCT